MTQTKIALWLLKDGVQMKLVDLLPFIIKKEDSVRLSHGLAVRYTKDDDEKGGTISLSRKKVPPSPTEVLVVMDTLKKSMIPPHEAAADNEIFESDGNFIVRIYLKWRNVH